MTPMHDSVSLVPIRDRFHRSQYNVLRLRLVHSFAAGRAAEKVVATRRGISREATWSTLLWQNVIIIHSRWQNVIVIRLNGREHLIRVTTCNASTVFRLTSVTTDRQSRLTRVRGLCGADPSSGSRHLDGAQTRDVADVRVGAMTVGTTGRAVYCVESFAVPLVDAA